MSARWVPRLPPAASSGRELFVQTKLWVSDYGYDEALHGFDVSAESSGSTRWTSTCSTSRSHSISNSTVDAVPAPWSACSRRVGSAPSGCPTSAPRTFMPSCPRADGRAGGEPGRGSPLLQPAGPSRPHTRDWGSLTQAWSPLGGVYVYSTGSRPEKNALEDPPIAAHCREIRQVLGPGYPPLAYRQRARRRFRSRSRPERIAENLVGLRLQADAGRRCVNRCAGHPVSVAAPIRTKSTSCHGTGRSRTDGFCWPGIGSDRAETMNFVEVE